MNKYRRKPAVVEAEQKEDGSWRVVANGYEWECEEDAFPLLYEPAEEEYHEQ